MTARTRLRLILWSAAAAGVLLVGTLQLKLVRLHALWVDEVFSLAVATGHSVEHAAALARPEEGDFVEGSEARPARDFAAYSQHATPAAPVGRVARAVFLSDTNPPGYYLLLHGWTRLWGVSDTDLRSFSVFWSLACIPLIGWLARRCGAWRAALPAMLLWCAAPAFLYYGSEGRMYSLVWFWLLVGAAATLKLDRARDHAGWWAVWVLASAGGLLTHYFFFFPWCGLTAYLAWRRRRGGLVALLLAGTLVVGLIAPWYRHLPRSLANWRVTQEWLNWEPSGFSRPGEIAGLATQYLSGAGRGVWWPHPFAESVALVAFLLVLGAAALRWRGRLFADRRLLLWGWFAAGCLGPVVFDVARHTYTVAVARYAITALPAVCLLGGVALGRLAPRVRLALLACIVGAWSFSVRDFFVDEDRNDQNYWRLGWMLDAETTAEDLVLVHSIPTGVIGVARYTRTSAPMAAWVGQLGTRTVPESIQHLVAGRRRVWFIHVHPVGAPAPEEAWLREHAREVGHHALQAIQVRVFEPRSGERF